MAFNPSKHIPLSKSLATVTFPIVAQSYYYDEALFVYRPYVDTAEVNAYIEPQFRGGSFDIVINFGGVLSGGVITGGENRLYWYDQGLTDADLKIKGGSEFNLALLPAPWTSDPTPLNTIRWKEIGGVTYPFYSLVEGNISEPTLAQGDAGAWTQRDDYGSVSLYNVLTAYSKGELIRSSNTISAPVYESKNNGNTGNNPPSSGVSDANWKYIGEYEGSWASSFEYQLNAVVYDPSSTPIRRRYVSNKDNNTSPLSDHAEGSTWKLLGLYKSTLSFTEANFIEESYGGIWYLEVDTQGKDMISIKVVQDGVTTYRGPDALSFQTGWALPRISGFPNNDPQTITIITI